MKLKKIASLMLAGVMAVSMLAGCSTANNNNSNDGGENNNVVTPTSIVTAVNNGQSATNKVKINFTSDATLDAALSKAVKAIGENADAAGLNVQMARLTGNDGWGSWKFLGNERGLTPADTSKDDGRVVEGMMAMPLMNAMADKAAAEKTVAKIVNEMVAKLDDTTLTTSTNYNDKYCDFSYTGTVSMVSSTANDGTVNYYFAVVITQTTAVKTLKPAA